MPPSLRPLIFLLALAILGVVLSACTTTSTTASTSAWSIRPLAAEESKLSPNEFKTWTVDVPSRNTVLLSVEAHIAWDQLAGSAPIMEVLINDAPVTAEFLINKPLTYTYADGRRFLYYAGTDYSPQSLYWVLAYSPDYDSSNVSGSTYQVLEGHATLYIFDITRLLRLGQANTITLANHGAIVQEKVKRPVPLVFRQVKLLENSQN